MDATKHMIYSAVSLLFLLSSCSSFYSPVVVVHARDIKFFFHNKVEPTASPEYAPAPAPGPATTAPAPGVVVVDNYYGYGLYGSDSNSNMVTPQKEQFTTNYEYAETTGSTTDNNNNNNNIDDEEEEMLLSKDSVNDETTSLEKEESAETHNDDDVFYNSNNDNGYFDKGSVTNSNGAYEGQAGMSDTRYMESGKYYYDLKSDHAHDLTNYGNNNGYTSTSTTTSDDEMLDPQVYGTGSGYNEFNTMEEAQYYQTQGYHNTKEQEYVP